jgi:hypothetical protein
MRLVAAEDARRERYIYPRCDGDPLQDPAARKWADGPLKVIGREKKLFRAAFPTIEAAYEEGETGGSSIRDILNVNRVSSDVELTESSPPCALAIWEAM